jgi:hypothetical protein
VHALLGAEEAVGVLPAGPERRRLDPGLLARARLEELDVEAALLGPAHEHAQDHLGPVLGVGPARAGVDGHERVAAVIGAREQALLFELAQLRLDRVDLLGQLVGQRAVLGGELVEALEVVDLALEGAELLELAARARVLRRDLGRALLVLPEAGRAHGLLELGDLALQPRRVKGSPRAA